MSQEQRMKGYIELIDEFGNSPGPRQGNAINPDAVPLILENTDNITGLVAVDPEPVGSRTPVGQWQGTDATGRPVTVKLWPEPVLDLAALAEALAAEQGGV